MAIVSITDYQSQSVETVNIRLLGRKLKLPLLSEMTVVYTTTTVKDWRPLTDIKRIAFALYENRGQDINSVIQDLVLLLPSYSRKPVIV